INGGNFSVAAGQTASGNLVLNTGATFTGTGKFGGAVTAASGTTFTGNGSLGATTVSDAIFRPGSSPGTLSYDGLTVSGSSNVFDWEIVTATGGALPPSVPVLSGVPGTDYDQILITTGNSLDLTGLTGFTVNMFGLSGLPDTQGVVSGFDPLQSYTWN
ncbi:MAG: hypothetical protein ACK53L_17165, partial [Pirellulaceae bacterium]